MNIIRPALFFRFLKSYKNVPSIEPTAIKDVKVPRAVELACSSLLITWGIMIEVSGSVVKFKEKSKIIRPISNLEDSKYFKPLNTLLLFLLLLLGSLGELERNTSREAAKIKEVITLIPKGTTAPLILLRYPPIRGATTTCK